ncbi:ferredoxin--NADP reductase [Fimbriiglobus ruber]|uniref:ferredoxin--NADP(+) reductase n=1 Tax=Fimbriiglobus ruber TaxID=1908690 RepID=A0A225EFY6_9BACT|nr:ferredoxin--NADP reductase [Fimbriiglobus ruber]OWK47255.1 Ferredoxin--NADP(+) reductase [Fimbriiglobus ruber]
MTPEQIADLRKHRYNGTVVYLHKIHSDLMVVRIRPDFPRPHYLPGQYCALGLGYWEPRAEGCQQEVLKPEDLTKLVRRSYSISNSVYKEPGVLRDMTQDDWVEFYIVLVRENLDGRVPALTPRLFALREGDRINIGEKITGHFTVEPVRPEDNVVFLGTGTGEAPHNSMLWDLLRRGHPGRILSACCVRYKKDLGYLDTHEELMRQFPNYIYLGLTTREAGATKKVYIQDLITSGELEQHLGRPLDPANTHVFLCGNPKMIGVPEKDKATGARVYPQPTGVIEILEGRGFAVDNAAAKIKGNVHFEEYW